MMKSGYVHILVVALVLLIIATGTGSAMTQDEAYPLYSEAWKLMVSRNYQEAIFKYDTLLNTFPDSRKAPEASYNIGYCWEKLDQKVKAFEQYKKTFESYPTSVTTRRAVNRALSLAKVLHREKGDQFDNFIQGLYDQAKSVSSTSHRQSAIRLAEMNDWRGQDELISGLKEGNPYEQVHISELLRFRVTDPEVRTALVDALKTHPNYAVRMNAISALSRLPNIAEARDAVIEAMKSDTLPIVRHHAARSLAPAFSFGDVQNGFAYAIGHENNMIVLMGVTEAIMFKDVTDPVKTSILERVKVEKDPTIKLVLTGTLEQYRSPDPRELQHMGRVLLENSEPQVRVSGIKILQKDMKDPNVRQFVVETLTEDKNSQVKSYALRVLAPHIDDAEVKEAIIQMIRTEVDPILIKTSFKVLMPRIPDPAVILELSHTLENVKSPQAADMIVTMLKPHIEVVDVKDSFYRVLTTSQNGEIKIKIVKSLKPIKSDEEFDYFADLYLKEPDLNLSKEYFHILQAYNRKRAEELRKQKGQEVFIVKEQ